MVELRVRYDYWFDLLEDDKPVAHQLSRHDAERIALALNTQSELLAAIEALLAELPQPNIDDPSLDAAIDLARAARDKAKGGVQ